MKRQGVLQLPPLDGMLVHRKVPPPPAFHQASLTIHQYLFTLLGGERNGESKVLCPRTNTLTQPSLKPRPLDAKSSALAIMPPRLAYLQTDQKKTHPLPTLLYTAFGSSLMMGFGGNSDSKRTNSIIGKLTLN